MENPNYKKLLFHPLITSSNQNENEIINRKKIKLLTYNFFLRPPPIKTNEDDYKEERLQDFFQYLPDFDIICFQEVFGSFHDRKKKMIKAAKENGYLYYLSSKSPSFFSKYLIDGGLLLISRFPIIENKYINYDYGVMSDGLSQKGAIYAKIQIKDYYLCLFFTHLQASYYDSGNTLWNFTIETRTKQTEDFINFIYDTIYNLNDDDLFKCKFIICGDFNIDAYDYINAREKFNLPKVKYTEYEIFKKKLSKLGKAIDLIENKFHFHPFTFGVNDGDNDKVLTGKEDFNSHQALDYIWEIIPDFSLPIFKKDSNINEIINTNDDNENLLENEQKINIGKPTLRQLYICYDTIKIEEFLIKNRPYQQLSDHFGVSVELSYGIQEKEKNEENKLNDNVVPIRNEIILDNNNLNYDNNKEEFCKDELNNNDNVNLMINNHENHENGEII